MPDEIDRRTLLKTGVAIGTSVSILLAGCAGNDEGGSNTNTNANTDTASNADQQKFLIALPAKQPTLDPRNIDLSTTLTWKHLLYNSPMKMRYVEDKDTFEYVPDLAKNYKWRSADDGGVTLTFNLRKDVKFHNGDPLTAELVKKETEYWMNPEMNSAQADILAPVNRVSVDNKHTVNFHLDAKYAPAAIYFSRYFTLANPYVREKRGPGKFAVNPKGGGTGPYELVEFNQGSNIKLKKYKEYHEKEIPPHFNEVELKIIPEQSTRTAQLKSGDIHLDNFVETQDWMSLQGNKNVETRSRPSVLFSYTALNHKVEPLGDKRVRRALRQAVNTKSFIKAVYKGQAQTVSLPHLPGSWWYWENHDKKNRYDPENAKKLLEEAGYADGFEFEIYVPTQSPYKKMGQVLKSMWSQVGITAKLQKINYSTMYGKIVKKDFVSHIGHFKDNPDPDYYFYSNGVPGGKWKAMTNGWKNQEYIDAIKEARSTTEQKKRKDLYNTAARIWAEEMPNLQYTVADNLVTHRKELQNYWVSPDTLSREALRQVSWQS